MASDLRAAVVLLLLCTALLMLGTRRAPPSLAVAPPPIEIFDLNRATAEELARLPGLGPERARRVIARRRTLEGGAYRSIEELLAVPGIGPKILDQLRPSLFIGPR